ncbi:uncharacterized protein LOC112569284 [Pomacea canaliculata]|uniref:uncharacterized protein LOC112569284 n=1 Tax=Pomacea canaliculata TaxID=400727 RepID=UPI000D739D48|nr:uncharacterized protein LOC112569284 [Pomacea canaliculata]
MLFASLALALAHAACAEDFQSKKAKKMILYQAKRMRLLLLTCVLLFILCQTTSWIVSAGSTAEMCFQYSSHQIQILIPEIAYQQSFRIFFIPTNKSQETVTGCKWSDKTNNYICNAARGYICEILENKGILILIPELQPGNFCLQIRKAGVHCICSWTAKELNRLGRTSNPDMASTGSSMPSPGGFFLLLWILGISIHFWKNFGHLCLKTPNNPDSSKDYTEQPLNTELDEREGENNSLNMLSAQLVSETSKNSPESSEDCTEQPLNIELHEREGENNSPNNRSTGNSNSYRPRNSAILHHRGAYIKDISSPSQTNIPDRGCARGDVSAACD